MFKTIFISTLAFFNVLLFSNFSVGQGKTNEVHVGSLQDFPTPNKSGEIKLNPFSTYLIHGRIDIGVNYIDLNGASLIGTDPGKDGIVSKTPGAVLRSTREMVYLEKVSVMNASSATYAYEFEDKSGERYCNLFAGCSVLDAPGMTSRGVGFIRGFNTVCIDLNYWDTADGLKVGGKMQKFTTALNYITGIKNGSGIEILPDAIITDVVSNSNYFVFKGETGIKVNSGAQIGESRFNFNLFRGQSKFLDGVDSFTPGWKMSGNGVGIPDTKAKVFSYMSNNNSSTSFSKPNIFEKIQGDTNPSVSQLFKPVGNNKFVYTGSQIMNVDFFVTVSGISSTYDGSYTIGVMKNGKEMLMPTASARNIPEGQGFNITLVNEHTVTLGDELEVFIKSNNNPKLAPVIITEMVFKITE